LAYQRFEEVAQLDDAALRLLLRQGDAVERVWSAWALGLARGASARPDFATGLSQSPDPGTRSQLLVILAGLGERELIRVLAMDDPDADVRATACRYLLRTRQNGDLATEETVRCLLMADLSPAVRRAILLEEHPRPLPLTEEHLTLLMATGDLKARQVVLARLLAEAPPSHLFQGVLENRIAVEPDIDLRRQIVGACLQAGGAERLAVLGATLEPSRRQEILDSLDSPGVLLPWTVLEPLATLDEVEVDEVVVLKLLDPATDREAWGWLLRISVRALQTTEPQRNRWFAHVAWQARPHLLRAARSQPARSDRDERQRIMALLADWRSELRTMEEDWDSTQWEMDDEDFYGGSAEIVSTLRELIAALETTLTGPPS
jgi:hypothetical protein